MRVCSTMDSRISRLKSYIQYAIVSFNSIIWVLGGGLFVLSVWFRVEPSIGKALELFEIEVFYGGINILIACSIIVMVIACIGCAAGVTENITALCVHVGLHVSCFVLGLAGLVALLYYSPYDILIKPLTEKWITTHQYNAVAWTFRTIQEKIGWDFTSILDTTTVLFAVLAVAICILHIATGILSVVLVRVKQKEKGHAVTDC